VRRAHIIEGSVVALVVFIGLTAAWVRRPGDVVRPEARVAAPPLPPTSPLQVVAVVPALAPPLGEEAAAPAPPPQPLDEPTLMVRLRSVEDGDSVAAIDLAREGDRRFADSPDAPERASILIHALASQGRASEARAEAEDMVNRYPDSSWVREVERFTGAHRHRNLRLTEAGSLEYY
jgi:hypothetical protein